MTKLYFKHGSDIKNVNDEGIASLAMKVYNLAGRDGIRLRVIVKNDNFESPEVQIAEYYVEYEEPWKSGWWQIAKSRWNGFFTPDETWELVELSND